jgi:hypothetical protein
MYGICRTSQFQTETLPLAYKPYGQNIPSFSLTSEQGFPHPFTPPIHRLFHGVIHRLPTAYPPLTKAAPERIADFDLGARKAF